MGEKSKKISFDREETGDFHTVLKKRVNLYFKENNLSPKSNVWMILKTFSLAGVVAFFYALLLSGFGGLLGVFAIFSFLGFLIAIAGMNIAHDALHGSYLSSPRGNRLIGLVMDFVGGSSFYWRKEHTVDHHTYTNIAEHDADLNTPLLLRLCPQTPRNKLHGFQHLYAPLLYSLNLLRWIYFSDFRRLYRFFIKKDAQSSFITIPEAITLVAFKIINITTFLIIPMLVLPMPPWQVFLAYLGFVSATGLTMTVIFQLAHIVEDVAFPLPNEEGRIENSFAKHQLMTTSNFGTRSRLCCFLFGGLNFQIEHHIFPYVCHIHLPKIAPIVKATAKEFGLPYYENGSFFGAIRSHFRTLRKFGKRVPLTQRAPLLD